MEQFGQLVASQVMELLFVACDRGDIPPDETVTAIVDVCKTGLEKWNALTAGDGEPSKEFSMVLDSVAVAFACLHPEEQRKPSTDKTRTARKQLLHAARTPEVLGSELGKAMTTYNAGRAAMHAAVEHSKTGLEDELAEKNFGEAVSKFQTSIEEFADAEVWVQEEENTVYKRRCSMMHFHAFTSSPWLSSVLCSDGRRRP